MAILTMVVLGALLLIFATLALLVASLTVVFAFDGDARIIAMALLALLYAVIAASLGYKLRLSISGRTPMFAATLAELARDRAALMKRAATEEDAHE